MTPLKNATLILAGALLVTATAQQHPSIHQLESERFKKETPPPQERVTVLTGLDLLLTRDRELLRGKKVGLVTNHTGVDRQGKPNYQALLELEQLSLPALAIPGQGTPTGDQSGELEQFSLKAIFTPEHGLFGEAADGQKVEYEQNSRTLPPVFSLYGKTRKPTPESLKGLNLIIYDIQDVGTRPYTYISTLGVVMEAAAETGIPVLVLDRPNPITGETVEGPPLDLKYRSFIGYYPLPLRYGMTVGEMALMIAGEGWINPVPQVEVTALEGWHRKLWYDQTDLPWIKPSPNITDPVTALLYSGLCLLQGTNVSEGRGTPHPFKWIGAPWINGLVLSRRLNRLNLPGVVFKPVQFTPGEIPGVASDPKYDQELCSGIEIVVTDKDRYQSVRCGLHILGAIQTLYPDQLTFREKSLRRLWGSKTLRKALQNGQDLEQLIDSYQGDLQKFLKKRQSYLLYD